MWLNKLKIAIAQEDTDSLDKLMQNIPQLKDIREMKSAVYLLKEATCIVEKLKKDSANSMKQIKKNLDFLNATKESKVSSFDVTL
ncbi:MAG: hypothetical protein GXO30_06135 [Epsilonproteobacteria bacterium]|nr:hypothetical protein [Campylobacterota bacterium]